MEDMVKPMNRLFTFEEDIRIGATIKVVGIGGGGCNAINRMIASNLKGVEFIAVNTDAQALNNSLAPVKLQIGSKLTKGLGAGANPEIGRQAALEDTERIIENLEGTDMVFITAGLGGGTGTGASPIIASLASELGALSVAVVTKPFTFEGKRRKSQAEYGLKELRESVDSIITIPNDRLMEALDMQRTLLEAFQICDDVLRQAVQGISDLIQVPGMINLDFADVKTVMAGMGVALMGIGVGEGENRAIDAARQAISNPLLEGSDIHGAKGLIFNLTGSSKMNLKDLQDAAAVIQEAADPNANIIFGMVPDEDLDEKIMITVIATGFERTATAMEIAAPPAGRSQAKETLPVVTSRLAVPLDEQPVFSEVSIQPKLALEHSKFDVPAYLRRKAE